MVLSGGIQRPLAMTYALTKAEISNMAATSQRHQAQRLVPLLLQNLILGAVTGAVIALFMLLTNTVGLFTLLRAQSDPIGAAIAFVLAGVMIFTPLVLAVAIGLAGRAK
jgi:hypothetical protein